MHGANIKSGLISKKFLIFAAIGLINTAVDVALFVFLKDSAGLPIVIANIISTSIALSVSYGLNSRFTFPGSNTGKKSAARFIAVTLTGLWVLQPIIIATALYLLANTSPVHTVIAVFSSNPERFDSAIAKLASVPFTLTWNYFWYQAVVFKKHSD